MRFLALTPGWRYGIAGLTALVGILLRFVTGPLLEHDVPIMISMIAVVASAWLFGFGPGICATAISSIGAAYLFLSPWDGQATITLSQGIRVFLFFLTGCLVSGLSEAVHRTTLAWRRAEEDKERLVLQERNRLAREIHDTLAQGLTGIIVQLQAVEDCLTDDPEAVRNHLRRAETLARESLTEARRSVHALRPEGVEQRDFAATLSHYVRQITEGTGISTNVAVQGDASATRLPTETRSELLRIAMEAVTNAVKHANPTRIFVVLVHGQGQLTLTIRDDGKGAGFPTGVDGGFGLIAMQERARLLGATFSWKSGPCDGTEVSVVVPLSITSRKEAEQTRHV